MIFLSHAHSDKPVVEPIALRLREIYGQEQVFYDSWSIQPGDGIIDKINRGLSHPKFVFFFSSTSSIKSSMVSLEWQNALYKATKGDCKVIPVRVDRADLPPILMQSLYIDLHSHGLEAAIAQIVSVIQGNNTFTPGHLGFSNLTYRVSRSRRSGLTVTISASHLMEPIVEFFIVVGNKTGEVEIDFNNGEAYRGGWNQDVDLENGTKVNGFFVAKLGGAITPDHPLKIRLHRKGANDVNLVHVLHRKSHKKFVGIPQILSN